MLRTIPCFTTWIPGARKGRIRWSMPSFLCRQNAGLRNSLRSCFAPGTLFLTASSINGMRLNWGSKSLNAGLPFTFSRNASIRSDVSRPIPPFETLMSTFLLLAASDTNWRNKGTSWLSSKRVGGRSCGSCAGPSLIQVRVASFSLESLLLFSLFAS